jgi:hypothetical protein
MCFSPSASFIASGVIASIGVATLRHVHEPRTLLFASVPMLFALHQFTEGLVWLGLDGRIDRLALHRAAMVFTLYAQAVLPILIPAAIALMELPGWRRRAILWLTALGAIVCIWDGYGLIFLPSRVFVDHNSIAYRNVMTGNFWISCVYIVSTCGSLLLSSHRVVRIYGVLNIFVLTIVQIVKEYAFASVWCFYAATMSALIYWQFRRGSIAIGVLHVKE